MIDAISLVFLALAAAVFWAMVYGWVVANTGGMIGLGNMFRALFGENRDSG